MTSQSSSTLTDAPRAGRTTWGPIVALASGIALLVGSEFLPAAVLPALADDLGVSEGTAGWAVAATAITGAATAPSIAVVLPRADRRTVLVALLLVAAASNVAVALSSSFVLLLVGRLLLGIAIAGYWSFAFGAGTSAVRGRDHVVSSSLALGVGVATVAGVPLASLIGDEVGWRAVFLGAGVLAALGAAGVALALPPVPAHPTAGLAMLRQAVRNRRLMAGIGCVVLVAFGNFMAYPYIRVAIEDVVPSGAAGLLLVWGTAGVAGTVAAGALVRWLRPVTAAVPLALAVGLALTAVAGTPPVLVVAVALWGLAFNMVPVTTQIWVTRVEPERAESAISLQVTAFQLAITGGSVAGGLVLDGVGIGATLAVGAIAAAAAGVGWALLRVPRA